MTPPNNRTRLTPWLLALLLAFVSISPAFATDAKVAELEKTVAELKAKLDQLSRSGNVDVAELERQIEVLAAEIEKLKIGEAATPAGDQMGGLAPAASKVYFADSGISIGGYGEALFESYDSTREDGAASGKTDKADFLRAIVYFGYKFDDQFVFNSEIEYEHGIAGEGQEGEVAVEFAYLDYLHSDEFNLRGGLVLIPMGFVNELHEPPVFHGARRPDVERNLIPATWRELGFGAWGDLGPFSYRAYLVNGLDSTGFSSSGIRGGRQKGAKAKAEDFALTGRLDYTGTPGLVLGGSFFIGNSDHGDRTADGASFDGQVTMWDLHAEWRWHGLDVRALWVETDIDDAAAINSANGLTGSGSIGEKQEGGYVQVGYDLFSSCSWGKGSLTPFVRFETFDTQAEVPTGFDRNLARDRDVTTLGIDYKPIDQIALKLEFQQQKNGANTGIDQWNLAIGYLF